MRNFGDDGMVSTNLIGLLCSIVFIILLFTCVDSMDPTEVVEGGSSSNYYQNMPGDLDYEDYIVSQHWNAFKETPRTELISYDLNEDGVLDVIFGTSRGRIIGISIIHSQELMNVSLTSSPVWEIDFGQLDSDDSIEIVAYSNKTLFIYDVDSSRIQWSTADYPSVRLMDIVDVSRSGKSDIILLTDKAVVRIDGNGTVIFNESYISAFTENLPNLYTWLIDDVDSDGQLELILISKGYNWLTGVSGRHLWMYNISDGQLLFVNKYHDLIFSSNLLPIEINNIYHVAVGLLSINESEDAGEIMVFNPLNHSKSVYNVYEGTSMFSWDYLTLVPSEVPMVVLSTMGGSMMAWEPLSDAYLWITGFGGSYHVPQPPIACDIDHDMNIELILTLGQVQILDSSDGSVEKVLTVADGTDDRRLIVDDFDGDSYSDLCFGYEHRTSDVYHLLFIYTPDIIIALDAEAMSPPVVFYAGKQNLICFKFIDMTMIQIPSLLNLNLTNTAMGTHSSFTIDLMNKTCVESEGDIIRISAVDYSMMENGISVRIDVIPDWKFSYDGLNDVTIEFFYWDVMKSKTFKEVFSVERDLVFVGELECRRNNLIMDEYDWVRSGFELTFSNFTVVYQNTFDEYPPLDSYLIMVSASDDIVNLTPEIEIGQSIRYRIPDADGLLEILIWVYQSPLDEVSEANLSFTVQVDNDPPSLLEDLTPKEVIKGHSFNIMAQFQDNILVEDVWVEYWYGDGERNNVSMTLDDVFSLEVSTPRNPIGDFRYRFLAVDETGNWAVSSETIVSLINSPPVIEEVPLWNVIEEEEGILDLSSYILDENDPLDVIEVTCVDTHVSIDNRILSVLHMDWVPDRTFTVTVSDGEDSVQTILRLSVQNINDPPSELVITSPKDGSAFDKGAVITLNVSYDDPDIIVGQVLTIIWTSDIDGEIGQFLSDYPKVISTDRLSPGEHTITANANDGEESRSDSIKITVIDDDRDSNEVVSKTSMIAIIMIFSIIIIAIVFWMRLRQED
ncbi:MAG: hypothetical protein ACXADF_16890 [Candidatus Thorarchaeota archaeon]